MATLFPPGLRLLDADGNPINGGKVRVYTANTTTLASLYSDVNLSSSILNPVETDAAGYPANGGNECAIYCASGSYDVAFLDADDTMLASWDDYAPAGEGTDIERTLTGNGRFKVTGSAGAVMIQVGDPSPDNTGGTLTIEGWAGTQGDALTLDFATVNTTGFFTENSKKIDGVVHTEGTFSAVSQVDIELTQSPPGVRAWELILFDMQESAPAQISARFSYDSGSSYKSGASDYKYAARQSTYNGGTETVTVSTSAGATAIPVAVAFASQTNRSGLLNLFILTPNSGSDHTIMRATGATSDAGANTRSATFDVVGEGVGGYGRATHIRLFPTSGTMTGKYRLRPLRGFGE